MTACGSDPSPADRLVADGHGDGRDARLELPDHDLGMARGRHRLRLVTVFPVYWMIQSAFEPGGDLTSLNPSFFPVHFTFHNFVSAVNHSAASGARRGRAGYLTSGTTPATA